MVCYRLRPISGSGRLERRNPSLTHAHESLNVQITAATPDDVPLILDLIKKLAEYERLAHRVEATEPLVHTALFGPRPAAEVIIARVGEVPVGFAVFFATFSTFAGLPGLFLEDLFVEADWRGRGVGGRLLSRLAAIALERGWSKINWNVLDWNETAIRFYQSIGGEPATGWIGYGVSGEALRRLAVR
jgi:GNAT superfamily N-acetyltransferase